MLFGDTFTLVKSRQLSAVRGDPRTQDLFGKDPGIVWSRDSTIINCPRGSGKVSNYMLPQRTLNFKYQEWDVRIHNSKHPLTSILYFCLLYFIIIYLSKLQSTVMSRNSLSTVMSRNK
jgi:hypothetical protein